MQKPGVKGMICRVFTLLLALICVSVLALPVAAAQSENGGLQPEQNEKEENMVFKEKALSEVPVLQEETGEGEDAIAPEDAEVFLEYYVLINNEWSRLDIQYKADKENVSYRPRYYTTPENLESIYGDFGFSAADYNGELFFPHTDIANVDTLWADALPKKVDGQWHIPLSFRNRSFIYYIPHNTEGYDTFFSTSSAKDDEAMKAENTFYSILISDPSGTETEAVGTKYVFRKEPYAVELAQTEGRRWRIINPITGEEVTPDKSEVTENGKLKLFFASLTQPLKITSVSEQSESGHYTIRYDAATLAYCLERLGELSVAQQHQTEEGTINGEATCDVSVEIDAEGEVETLRPDKELLRVTIPGSKKDKKYDYRFAGWRMGDSHVIFEPDRKLTAAEIERFEVNGVLTLNAVWSGVDKNQRVTSANFYVNMKCEIADNLSNGFIQVPEEDFTNSVYTAAVFGTESVPVEGDSLNCILIAPPEKAENAYETDALLRSMATQPYEGMTINDFPSDEDVLRVIRQNGHKIEIDGTEIPSDELTTEHFKVRWYVCKYQKADGWHIDGVLVAKEAFLRVTKTFLGDQEAVGKVTAPENDYQIKVAHVSASARDEEDLLLTLKPEAEENRDGYLGYHSYDAETNTYVWITGGRATETYTLQEINYTLDDNWYNTNRYRVINSEAATDGWMDYSGEGVTVQMESYPNDLPEDGYQTVAFHNTYLPAGVLTINKLDAFTSTGLSDVAFTLSAGGQPVKLYRKTGTAAYSTDSRDAGFAEPVLDGRVVTDQSGNVYLTLPTGDYVLKETLPDGYNGAASLAFTVDESASVTKLAAYDAEGAEITELSGVAEKDKQRLNVYNQSRQLTTVKTVVDWGSTPENQRKNVTLELLCNGVRLKGAEFTQQVNAENDWTYVWNSLPLFMSGELAHYSVKEIRIGDVAYDSDAGADGYREYVVVGDPARYREGDEGAYMDEATWEDEQGTRHYSNHVLLRMNNRLDQGTVSVFVSKQWVDGSDERHRRPSSVIVRLLRDGEESGSTLTLNDANNWQGEFSALPKYDNGREIAYSVEEAAVDGYTAEIIGSMAAGFCITNTYVPEMTSIRVEKIWVGDMAETRPGSITVSLLADGEVVKTQAISADAEGAWTYTFENLPVYAGERQIVYSVAESPVEHYTAAVDGFRITNTYSAPSPKPKPGDSTEPVPTAAPTFTQKADDGTWNAETSPKTGDTEPLLLWIGLMAICAVAAVRVSRRKKA